MFHIIPNTATFYNIKITRYINPHNFPLVAKILSREESFSWPWKFHSWLCKCTGLTCQKENKKTKICICAMTSALSWTHFTFYKISSRYDPKTSTNLDNLIFHCGEWFSYCTWRFCDSHSFSQKECEGGKREVWGETRSYHNLSALYGVWSMDFS